MTMVKSWGSTGSEGWVTGAAWVVTVTPEAVVVTVRLPAAVTPAARSSTMRTVQSLPG